MFSIGELLDKLVRIPSPSGQEGAIALFVAGFCRQLGQEVWMVDGSVAVRIKGLNRHRAVIFNGHLDTVPGDWPGALHVKRIGDRLVGLGVTDMKSGLAVMCYMAQVYSFMPPPIDVWLLFSREEETTQKGSLDLAPWWASRFHSAYDLAGVIILEPTANSYVAFGHKGGGVYRGQVLGPGQRHGSTNLVDEVTALDLACRLGVHLKALQSRMLAEYPSDLGPATVNLTQLTTPAIFTNVVPDRVAVAIDWRTNGSLTHEALIGELQMLSDGFALQALPDFPGLDGRIVRCPNPEPLREAFQAGWPGLAEGFFPAAVDMNAFLPFGLPTAICGPGNESLHQVAENIPIGAMSYSYQRLTRVVSAFASI